MYIPAYSPVQPPYRHPTTGATPTYPPPIYNPRPPTPGAGDDDDCSSSKVRFASFFVNDHLHVGWMFAEFVSLLFAVIVGIERL